MNREPNKEIDILLRKLSGKQNGNIAAADGNSSALHEHLDADELNAYAENALPAALRSRYTEHLADCSSCRKLVTQLTLSSTAATVPARVEERTPSRLKTLLAALLSPVMIRYAVPAMAVLLVVALAWIVVRRGPMSEQVAQNEESRPQQAVVEKPNSQTAAPVLNDSEAPSKQPQPTPQEPERKTVASEESVGGRTVATEAPEPAVAAKAPAGNKEGEEAAKRDATPAPVAAAPASTTGAGIAPSKAVSDLSRNEPEPKKKAEIDNANVQNQQAPKAYEQQRSGPSEPRAVQRGNNRTQANEAQREVARSRAADAEKQDKDAPSDDEAEVRTVGGHKFTKRGRAWVDALYDPNSATTNVSRGSEQFRSLIGDEPGLRSIVEQLNGEVIVVWKSRAYRFR